MKNSILAFAILTHCLFDGFTTHAQITRQVPGEIILAFDINFNETSLLRWEKAAGGYRAVFNQGNGRMEAYFSREAELKGLARYIESNELPVKVTRKLSRQYARFLPEEICEYRCNVNGLCYIISMQNEKIRQIVKLSPAGKLLDSERQRIKKTNNAIVRKQ